MKSAISFATLCVVLLLGACPLSADEWVPPSDWSAGARVSAFLKTYLEQNILAPLDSPATPPRTALGELSVDFAAHLQAAASPTEHALYANAVGLCDLLGRLLDERERQQESLVNARTGSASVSALDMPATAVNGHYSYNLEKERERGQENQSIQAQLNALDKKNFFVNSKLRQWTDQSVNHRRAVQAAAINVSAAQIRADAAARAPVPAAPVAAAPATAAAPAPRPAATH